METHHKTRKVVNTYKISGGCYSLGTIFLHVVCGTFLVDYDSVRSCLGDQVERVFRMFIF